MSYNGYALLLANSMDAKRSWKAICREQMVGWDFKKTRQTVGAPRKSQTPSLFWSRPFQYRICVDICSNFHIPKPRPPRKKDTQHSTRTIPKWHNICNLRFWRGKRNLHSSWTYTVHFCINGRGFSDSPACQNHASSSSAKARGREATCVSCVGFRVQRLRDA